MGKLDTTDVKVLQGCRIVEKVRKLGVEYWLILQVGTNHGVPRDIKVRQVVLLWSECRKHDFKVIPNHLIS